MAVILKIYAHFFWHQRILIMPIYGC